MECCKSSIVKKKIKKIILKKLLSNSEAEKLAAQTIVFPGGLKTISETKPEDVFIVGFPKSGNTLMQHIIAHLVYGLNNEASRSMVNLIVPDIYANSHYFRFNDRCFFKSHDLPKPEYKKVIYIMRDGREALLSYYHMMYNMGKPVSLEDLYSNKIKLFGATWSEHIEAWEKNPFNSEILWIRYEDLYSNKLIELEKICVFLNLNRSVNELNEVEMFTSFEFMSNLETKSDWKQIKSNKNFTQGSSFVRKGKLDTYKEEVTENLIKYFNDENTRLLKKYYNDL